MLPAGDAAIAEVDKLIAELTALIESTNYQFDRRFLFRATPECCHPGQGQECALFPSPS